MTVIRNAIAVLLAFFAAVELTPQAFPNRDAAGTALTFDVASVKPSTSDGDPASRFALGPGDAFAPGGLFSAINQPLIAYLRFAFKLGANDLPGLPAWVYTDRFDIEARSTANPTKDQMRSMMQSLLVDRFRMKTHIARQTRPVFELTLAKRERTGPQLRPHSQDDACVALGSGPSIACGTAGPAPARLGGNGRLVGRGVSIARLAALFTNPFTGVDRPVVDRTGLTGTFDFDVEWCLPIDSAPAPGAPVEMCEPTFRQAIEDQLGLTMKRSTGPVAGRVIDHIERPSAN
jgi:uncharacterized protein (TIGR03435 family)